MEDEIASQIHDEPIGATSSRIHCDGIHNSPQPVEPSARVQYECIRVGESMTNLRAFGILEGWGPDLLRCPDCEFEALDLPTDGYAEALVEVDVDHSGESYGWSTNQGSTRTVSVRTGHGRVPKARPPVLSPKIPNTDSDRSSTTVLSAAKISTIDSRIPSRHAISGPIRRLPNGSPPASSSCERDRSSR